MALGMLGDVRQEADDCGWQTLAANFARLGERCRMDAPHHCFRLAENAIELGEKRIAIGAGCVFGRRCPELFRRQLTPLHVGHQALRASRDVPHVEAYRSESMRGCPELVMTQTRGVMRQIFACLLERIEHWGGERMRALNWSA
jgi:hypothetical protein